MVIKENVNYPKEGYFWIINNKVIGITTEVPHYDYEYKLNGNTPKNS